MHNLLGQLREGAERLIERLDQAEPEEFVAFVEERDVVLQQVKAALALSNVNTAQYQPQVFEILRMDRVIRASMQDWMTEAGATLTKRGQSRAQKQAYENSYSIDSVYIYHRK